MSIERTLSRLYDVRGVRLYDCDTQSTQTRICGPEDYTHLPGHELVRRLTEARKHVQALESAIAEMAGLLDSPE
jgi:hypothetical protein